jgi:hypothetical protein
MVESRLLESGNLHKAQNAAWFIPLNIFLQHAFIIGKLDNNLSQLFSPQN